MYDGQSLNFLELVDSNMELGVYGSTELDDQEHTTKDRNVRILYKLVWSTPEE